MPRTRACLATLPGRIPSRELPPRGRSRGRMYDRQRSRHEGPGRVMELSARRPPAAATETISDRDVPVEGETHMADVAAGAALGTERSSSPAVGTYGAARPVDTPAVTHPADMPAPNREHARGPPPPATPPPAPPPPPPPPGRPRKTTRPPPPPPPPPPRGPAAPRRSCVASSSRARTCPCTSSAAASS